MKFKSLSFVLSSLLLSIILVGCSIDDLATETDPNNLQPGSVSKLQLLPGPPVVVASVYCAGMNQFGNVYTGSQVSGNGLSLSADQRYQLTSQRFDGTWQTLFASALFELDQLELQSQSDSDQDLLIRAYCKTLRAFTYQAIVDLFGSAPLDEAFQGSNNLTPAYNTGEEIYDAMVTTLDEAIAELDAGGSAAGSGISAFDVMFRGNTTLLRRFNRTLKLRLLLRQVYTRSAVVTPLIDALLDENDAAGGTIFMQANENIIVQPGYLASSGKTNPLYNVYRTEAGRANQPDQFFRANEFAISKLTQLGDPRINRLYNSVPDRDVNNDLINELPLYRGWSLGPVGPVADSNGVNFLSRMGLAVYDRNSNAQGALREAYLMLASESLFLQAEASLRAIGGRTLANAQTLYNAAIAESFNFIDNYGTLSTTAPWNLTLATYQAQTGVALTGANFEADLERLITQKWISQLNIIGFENWTEWRRTGYPSGIPLTAVASQPIYPLRTPYPQSEVAANSNNVPTADYFNDLIFWDAAANTVTPATTGIGR